MGFGADVCFGSGWGLGWVGAKGVLAAALGDGAAGAGTTVTGLGAETPPPPLRLCTTFATFVKACPAHGKSTRHTIFAAIHAAEQFLPFVHRLRFPPTADAFARAILLSLG